MTAMLELRTTDFKAAITKMLPKTNTNRVERHGKIKILKSPQRNMKSQGEKKR